MKYISMVLIVVLLIILVIYSKDIYLRKVAVYSGTVFAPNGKYKIDYFSVPGREPSCFYFKIYNRDDTLIGEYLDKNYYGQFSGMWECDADMCTEYYWGAHDGNRIKLPLSFPLRMRALLP